MDQTYSNIQNQALEILKFSDLEEYSSHLQEIDCIIKNQEKKFLIFKCKHKDILYISEDYGTQVVLRHMIKEYIPNLHLFIKYSPLEFDVKRAKVLVGIYEQFEKICNQKLDDEKLNVKLYSLLGIMQKHIVMETIKTHSEIYPKYIYQVKDIECFTDQEKDCLVKMYRQLTSILQKENTHTENIEKTENTESIEIE